MEAPVGTGSEAETRDRFSRARARRAISNQAEIGDGEHAGHTPPDQGDSQYGADHQGDADGGGVENAARAAARGGQPPIRRAHEQGFGFAATAHRSAIASAFAHS